MVSSFRRRALLVSFAGSLVFASSVSRVSHAEPSLSDRETARALMDDGDAKRDKNDMRGALKAYEAADAIMKVPTTGLEVGRAQAALGLLLEARETLSRVMRLPAKPGEPPPFTTARKTAETLSTEIGTRIPSVTVVVQNAEPGQTVQLVFDGDPVPPAASAAPRKVNPGKHTITARATGAERTEEISVAERENKTVTIDLAKRGPAAVVGPAADGTTKTDAPAEASSDGGGTWKTLTYVGFGVGAVGIVVGSITGIMSISKVSDIESRCVGNRCNPSEAEAIDSAKSLGTVSTVAFIVGGAGVGLGVLGLIMQGKSSSEPAASTSTASATNGIRVRPELGPTWAGLSGSF